MHHFWFHITCSFHMPMWTFDWSEYSMHHILTCQLILKLPLTKQQTPTKLNIRTHVAQYISVWDTKFRFRWQFKYCVDSLQVLCPWCRIRHGHEATVGQYSAHYEQAKQRGKEVKESVLWRSILQFYSSIGFCDKPAHSVSCNPMKYSH